MTVTCLMPGATDTAIGQGEKDDPKKVARAGYEAMRAGEGDVVGGWKNKAMAAASGMVSSERLAAQHRKMAEPGSGKS
ncbi:hypothetical protein Mame_04460 (plasmid) [Martelella mediterranea DSM 17316]|uniref:Uncharacterized protein n=1 Tax=Martelella mediterranea DSM 17316 TaxID=1122214 RepID=A0A1U9Z852_9HYPH|nr:hypothetical protein Mame_04460 [Martelella mediterranea DSM 17316]